VEQPAPQRAADVSRMFDDNQSIVRRRMIALPVRAHLRNVYDIYKFFDKNMKRNNFLLCRC